MAGVKPRLLHANRFQQEFRGESLDELLPPEHEARDVWAFVERLDLSELLAKIKSVPGVAGAPAVDPRILVAIWMFATVKGVGSARALAKLCEEHLAFRWLAGGVSLCHKTLSDFRTEHTAELDRLLTQSVAALMAEGLVDLERVAQDGVKVRASAGTSSFRRRTTLDRCLEEAKEQVAALKSQVDEDQGAASRREQAARERAAKERVERLEQARRELAKLEAANAAKAPSLKKKAEKLRASTTDPEARVMKMADGGFRPAYNVQFATDVSSGVVVGVEVTNAGTDAGEMPPMIDQVEARTGRRPRSMLVDGGFAALEAIDAVERGGSTVYAPVRNAEKEQAKGKDPYARKPGDTDAVADWRSRMKTDEAKEVYKQRASTAELTNAQARNRGMQQVLVRGRPKVLAVMLWQALVHNFTRHRCFARTRRRPDDPQRTPR